MPRLGKDMPEATQQSRGRAGDQGSASHSVLPQNVSDF